MQDMVRAHEHCMAHVQHHEATCVAGTGADADALAQHGVEGSIVARLISVCVALPMHGSAAKLVASTLQVQQTGFRCPTGGTEGPGRCGRNWFQVAGWRDGRARP